MKLKNYCRQIWTASAMAGITQNGKQRLIISILVPLWSSCFPRCSYHFLRYFETFGQVVIILRSWSVHSANSGIQNMQAQCVQNPFQNTIRHGCSPVNLLHILKTPFFKKTYGWLLGLKQMNQTDVSVIFQNMLTL